MAILPLGTLVVSLRLRPVPLERSVRSARTTLPVSGHPRGGSGLHNAHNARSQETAFPIPTQTFPFIRLENIPPRWRRRWDGGVLRMVRRPPATKCRIAILRRS